MYLQYLSQAKKASTSSSRSALDALEAGENDSNREEKGESGRLLPRNRLAHKTYDALESLSTKQFGCYRLLNMLVTATESLLPKFESTSDPQRRRIACFGLIAKYLDSLSKNRLCLVNKDVLTAVKAGSSKVVALSLQPNIILDSMRRVVPRKDCPSSSESESSGIESRRHSVVSDIASQPNSPGRPATESSPLPDIRYPTESRPFYRSNVLIILVAIIVIGAIIVALLI
jgi:hypothetical protein